MSEWQKISTLVTFGNTWNIVGIGKTYVESVTTHSQTVSLLDTNSARFWLPGNGVDSYLITSASITQGSLSTPIRMNGKTSFYVPKEGRWSDWVSIANFALPGDVTFSFSIANTAAKIPTAPTAPTTPVGVSAYESRIDIIDGTDVILEVEEQRLVFDLQFENDYTDSINGIEPTLRLPDRVSIDITSKMFDKGCLKIAPEAVVNEYGNIGMTGLTRAYNLIPGEGSPGIGFLILLSNDAEYGGYWLTFNQGTPVRCLGSGNYTLRDQYDNQITVTVAYPNLPKYGGSCYITMEDNLVVYDLTTVLDNLLGAFTISMFSLVGGTLVHDGYVYVPSGDNIYVYILGSGQLIYLGGMPKSALSSLRLWSDTLIYYDGIQIIEGLIWADDFTVPPTGPIVTAPKFQLTEVTTSATITVTTNPEPGGTITLKGSAGGEDIVFTFVDHYPSNTSQIQIGADTSETASNIATAINNIDGAEFVATAEGNVVTVTGYTQTQFSMEITGDGLTISKTTQIFPGFNQEEANVRTEFEATEGGKSVQENVSVSTELDGLIDGLSETVSATAVIDCLMDSMDENANASAASDNFDGLIDYMGDET